MDSGVLRKIFVKLFYINGFRFFLLSASPLKKGLLFFLFSFCFFSEAKLFCTSYICFEIPKSWSCIPEGAHQICHNKIKRLAKEAIIIMVAKETGSQDNLSEYINYLKQKKNYKTKKGHSVQSRVFHSKQRSIHRHLWADGFHLASEIPKYYTRYLGSTKQGLAVLVTYTAHQKLWKKYSKDFNTSIQSLRFLNVDEALRKLRAARGSRGSKGIRDYLEDIIGDGEIDVEGEDGDSSLMDLLAENWDKVLGGGIAAGTIGFLMWRRRRSSRSSQLKKTPSGSKRRRKKRL